MNERSHELDFFLAEQRDGAALERLLGWLDSDLSMVSNGLARRTGVSRIAAYEEIRQEFVVALLEHKIHWEHH
jgi:thioredoxin-like negative regulator of GroEL